MSTVTLESLQAEITQLRTLIEVMVNSERLHQVGGYASGRTSKGAAFIILYPAAPHLKHKVCRVYEEDFGKLPPIINTRVPQSAQEGNPDREQAIRQKIYHACPVFTIATRDGQDTQMGPEVRFSRVIEPPQTLVSTAPVAAASTPTGEMFEYRYQNGKLAETDEERRAFDVWRRAHAGKSPISRAGLRTWWAANKPKGKAAPRVRRGQPVAAA